MKTLFPLLFLLIFSFSGFSQDPDNPFITQGLTGVDTGAKQVTDAKGKLCGSLDGFASTLNTFNNLGADAKIDQYKDVSKLTDQSWESVEKAAVNVPGINIKEIKKGYDSIKELISSLDVTSNLIDSAPKIKEAVQTTLSAVSGVTSVSCK